MTEPTSSYRPTRSDDIGQLETLGMKRIAGNQLRLFRLDAARWVRPQLIADPDQLTVIRVVGLLVRHVSLRAVAWFRFASACHELGIRGVPSFVQRRLLRVYGLELSPGTPIGGGLYIAHPVGCVLFASSIGTNATVIGRATFGTRGEGEWPVLGDEVYVGVGACVLGGITVGDRAVVGANAVVVHPVEPGTTVVGIPARPLPSRTTEG